MAASIPFVRRANVLATFSMDLLDLCKTLTAVRCPAVVAQQPTTTNSLSAEVSSPCGLAFPLLTYISSHVTCLSSTLQIFLLHQQELLKIELKSTMRCSQHIHAVACLELQWGMCPGMLVVDICLVESVFSLWHCYTAHSE